MGFLKFLKREKKPDANELDLPPEPPPLEGFEERHGFELPEIKAPEDFDLDKFSMPEFDKAEDGYEPKMPEMKYEMPKFPEFPDIEEEPTAPAEPEMPEEPIVSTEPRILPQPLAAPAPVTQPMPAAEQKEMPVTEHMQRRRLFHHEKRAFEHARKEVYVRVDKFKSVLDGISMIRASVRKSDEALMRLENIKNSKDRAFDKVKLSLEDLQKKLIFIDKTLFKGD